MSSKLLLMFNLELNSKQVNVHLGDYWPDDWQSQHNSWTTWTRRGGGESCVRTRRPSTRTSERPPHDPSSMCPGQTLVEENVIGDMAENSPAEESADPNGPLDSVEARLGQISATLDSLSTELAILRASRRRGSELLLEEVESPPLQLVLEPKTRKSGGDPSSSVFKKSSVVRLNVGGKVFHVSWQLLQQVCTFTVLLHICFVDE